MSAAGDRQEADVRPHTVLKRIIQPVDETRTSEMDANTRHPLFAPAPAIPSWFLDQPSAPPSGRVCDKSVDSSSPIGQISHSQGEAQILEDDQSHEAGHVGMSSRTPALTCPEEDIIQRCVRARVS